MWQSTGRQLSLALIPPMAYLWPRVRMSAMRASCQDPGPLFVCDFQLRFRPRCRYDIPVNLHDKVAGRSAAESLREKRKSGNATRKMGKNRHEQRQVNENV